MLYTRETLYQYCESNNITLIKNYKDIKLKRENYIEGKCSSVDCINTFNKIFRQLVKTGAYCEECMKQIVSNKIKEKLTKFTNVLLHKYCSDHNIVLFDYFENIHITEKTIIKGKCLTNECSNTFSKTFRELLKHSGYCGDCCKENGKIKIINTNLEKYGVECCLLSEKIKAKGKTTMMKKYGVEFASQSETFKQNMKNNNLQKYGVEHVLQIPELRKQIIKTNLQKYGAENYFGTKECQKIIIQTNFKKYGVEHHSQNSEIAEKMLKCSYNKKQYTMPSGKIIDYQGYENFAFDELINIEEIEEDDLFTNRKEVPEIWYLDKLGKKRRHYVDMFIKSQNRCIEVKSNWTNQDKNNVSEKQKAAIEIGYKYDIWVYDNKGNKLSVH